MPNEISLRFKRASLSVALVASVFCAGLSPVFAQTVQKNSDGSVEAYDEGDSAQSESVDSGGGSNNTMQKGYRAGTTPYQKKLSDGTTVKRNSDGTIETWDEGETHHYSGGLPVSSGASSHRRSTKHTTRSSSKAKTAKVTTSTSTVKKKTK